jgi:glycosyltransferase involved in cell wall biosynthesis
MPRILLFIPMYNCEKQIVRVLGQLDGKAGSYIDQVIVVNNRSTDGGEAAVLERLEKGGFPCPVKLLRNRENYGLGGSHKLAFPMPSQTDSTT